jgi:hypothetical protein
VLVVLEIERVNVGFVTIAEPPEALEERLEDLADYPCAVIVCATRSARPPARTNQAVESLEARGYRIEWVEKERSASEADYERDNRIAAADIVRRVLSAVYAPGGSCA